jgi:hypothetical protein
MKKITFLSILIMVFVSVGCDAPSPFTWQGDYQRNNDVFDLVSTVVGTVTVSASPTSVNSVDDRVVITATVKNLIGHTMQDVYVTFTTDTGFFRSDEFGPSEIFTTPSDSDGKAYAHMMKIGRTCTVKVEAGGFVAHVVITFG